MNTTKKTFDENQPQKALNKTLPIFPYTALKDITIKGRPYDKPLKIKKINDSLIKAYKFDMFKTLTSMNLPDSMEKIKKRLKKDCESMPIHSFLKIFFLFRSSKN